MKKCIICGAALEGEPLLLCKDMPAAAQHMPAPEEAASDGKMDLPLYQCPECGLIQFDTEPVWYYRDVIRSGGYSTTMFELRKSQYRRFMEICPLEGKKGLEAGCGRGEFLRVWREAGLNVEAWGVEHDPALVEEARKDGLRVSRGFAGDGDTVLEGAPFDAFCSFNFLEHQPDPRGMLRCIRKNLKERAWGLITVPSFEYILEQDGFYELIRDHIANYTEESLRLLLELSGFRVLEMTRVNRDTLSAIVEKRPRADVRGLAANRDIQARRLTDFFREATADGRRAAVWGASHQGFTLLSNIALERYVSYVIDSAPFKQGKLTAGSHLPIVSPAQAAADPVDTVLIVAPGYTEEIASILRRTFPAGTRIAALRTDQVEMLPSGRYPGKI